MLQGVKRVRVWPIGTLDVTGSAEGRFWDGGEIGSAQGSSRHHSWAWVGWLARRTHAEFVLRPGDLWYAPPDMYHAVRTEEPSVMMSANYFPVKAKVQVQA